MSADSNDVKIKDPKLQTSEAVIHNISCVFFMYSTIVNIGSLQKCH